MDEQGRVSKWLRSDSIWQFLGDDTLTHLFLRNFRVKKVMKMGAAGGSRVITVSDWENHLEGKTHHATFFVDEQLVTALQKRGFFSGQEVAVSVFFDEKEAEDVRRKIAQIPRANVAAVVFS